MREVKTTIAIQSQTWRKFMKYIKMNCISTQFLLTIFMVFSFLLYHCPVMGADIPKEIKLLLYDTFKISNINYTIVNIYGLQNKELSLEAQIKFYITKSQAVKSSDTDGIATLKEVLVTDINASKIKQLQKAIDAKVNGSWDYQTWLKLFQYIENHHNKFFDLGSKRFSVIDARQLDISNKLKQIHVDWANKNILPLEIIMNALPSDFLNNIVQSNPNNGKNADTDFTIKFGNLSKSITELYTQIENLSKTIDQRFPQALLEKIDDIKSEVESLKNKISGFSPNGGTTSFLKVGLLLGVVFLFIVLQIFLAFRKHENNSRNNLSQYRDDIITRVSDQLNRRIPSNINSVLRDLETKFENLRYIIQDSVEDTLTGNQKDELKQDINSLENKTDQLYQTLVIGKNEDPAVMTVLDRVEEVRKLVLFLQDKVSPGNALSPQGKSNRTVSENAKASSRQRNGPLPKTEEKEDPMKIKFNLDDL